jgi:hypothetical protein
MSLSPLPLLEAFKWRHSVRCYAGGPFTQSLQNILDTAISKANTARTPFSTQAQLKTAPPGVSSYGAVRGQSGWIFPCIPKGTPKTLIEPSKIDAAVRGQITVMELSRYKIGTIWLGGYSKRSADKLVGEFETVAGIPYGFGEGANLSISARLAKLLSQSHKRKPIEEIFWDVEKKKPYTEESAKDLLPVLQAIRFGPSGVNRQPWRFAVDGSRIHVYKTKKDFASGIDIGIAIGNIEVLALENSHSPVFSVATPAPPAFLGGTYVCTVSFRD